MFRRLWEWLCQGVGFIRRVGSGAGCGGVHHAIARFRYRVDRAGIRAFCAAVTREERVECQDCGEVFFDWRRAAGPQDLASTGIELTPADWEVVAGGPLYLYPKGPDERNH